MGRILYYLVIKPLSLLPAGVLYALSDFLYFILYRVVGYRKEVVFTNLRNSFPEKSEEDLKRIAKEFYSHLCDLIVESIMLFSMTDEEVFERFKIANPEVIDRIYDQGRSVVGVTAHCANWEWASSVTVLQLKHRIMGIYTPLSDPFMNKKIQDTRGRGGLKMVSKKKAREFFNTAKYFTDPENPTLTIFISDQWPNPKRAYWTTFLNQETAVAFGAEKLARKYNLPVILAHISKLGRGRYEIEVELISENPAETPEGEVTEKFTRQIEQHIRKKPEYWLWSHKRWKKSRREVESSS